MYNSKEIIEKLYNGELYPMEEIYNQLENHSEFKSLNKRAEVIEIKLKQGDNERLLEEYSDLYLQLQHIVSSCSFNYGMKIGARIIKEL